MGEEEYQLTDKEVGKITSTARVLGEGGANTVRHNACQFVADVAAGKDLESSLRNWVKQNGSVVGNPQSSS